ncbi:M61 family metallopeptidase [Sediminibacterium ginsengisoli]|uniref:Predicted metalloprotease, contains C-terminal PDZ domain n=1 Tax=Sediminibacterium ginsengisoli TaxID=413434 RepID=A0A1T4PY97_9BACT|nr:hypothetical protein [Sediminibacterium ginsengisoli]SJZ96492.1 Predicted metalloprotease, contains C-terminal PDZ domain [Sediminibacterium ginsengisoli]
MTIRAITHLRKKAFRGFMFLVMLTAITAHSSAQKAVKKYDFTMDLNQIDKDRFVVELLTPAITASTIHYYIPKTVPGTYSDDNYGYFVEELKAFDKNGKELTTEHPDVNTWKINDASKLYRITYKVNDTYDAAERKEKVFEPAGTNIQKDTSYVINTHAVLGYFEGMEQIPYQLTIKHPERFYGSTAMTDHDQSRTADVFRTGTYGEIVDNPIMYCEPDTATIKVNNAEVVISVYSPNKVIRAAALAKHLDTLLQAQGKYIRSKLPVDRYVFIINLTDKGTLSGSIGALEHSYCSFYNLIERAPEQFMPQFKNMAAHEFFHILTPLNVHSEEIQYFDFAHPKMSEHLWLYEGTTEYHAHAAQVRAGMITPEQFFAEMGGKITSSRMQYKDTLPFTFMSKHVLEPEYAPQYGNVYEKGALIAMALDLRLRQLSGGKYDIISLVTDLSKKYGKGKPFKDSELFDVIGKLTYPQIKDFLTTYVGGSTPLPLEEIFASAGIKWDKEQPFQVYSLGGFRARAGNGKLIIASTATLNDIGKKMGYAVGDTILAINGRPVDINNFMQVQSEWQKAVKAGDDLTVTVARKEGDASKNIELKTKAETITQRRLNVLSFDPAATPEQVKLRNEWLNIKS